MDSKFGIHLKDWRNRRRMSQMDLGLHANVSARHIAFLETGRSKPSRPMVLQLSEALTVPLADRNTLLNAAGFAPAYHQRDMDDLEMSHVREAAEWTLERHSPYPAFAIDRHWSIVMANTSAKMLLAGIELSVGDSMLNALTGSPLIRNAVENWPEVARHLSIRLRTESAHLGGDGVLDKAADKLAEEIAALEPDLDTPFSVAVPTRYRAGDITLSFISTIAQFGSAVDIALADLKLEFMFPADATTRNFFISQAGNS